MGEVFEEGRVCYHVSSDYVKWFDGVDHKQWRIGRIMTYEGKMNTEIDLGYMRDFSVEVKEKDPADRTRTLSWYCESTVEELENMKLYDILGVEGAYMKDPTKVICGDMAGWCKGDMTSELYSDELMAQPDKDEL